MHGKVRLCYGACGGSGRKLACVTAIASFLRHRRVVLEPVRRVGIDPAKHGTPQPVRQATRAVVEALGGRYRIWFASRQLGALDLAVPIAPEHARQVQHQMGQSRGEVASPRDHALVRRRQWEDWVAKCTQERLRSTFQRAAIVLEGRGDEGLKIRLGTRNL